MTKRLLVDYSSTCRVSPLAKNFVGRSNAEVNEALGFSETSPRPERKPYEEVDISGGRVRRVKLVSTFRDEGSLLFRHSVHLEEALEDYGVSGRNEAIGERGFSEASIEEIPHLLYGFRALPAGRLRQMEVEFPHYETRRSRVFLRMFHCDLGGPSGWIPENRPT